MSATKRLFMSVGKCEKCGGDLGESLSACPACGTPAQPAIPASAGLPRTGRKMVYWVLAALVLALAGWFFLSWLAMRQATVSPTKADALPDFAETQAKAERGDADAQKNLGKIYAKGESVKQDYALAARWYRQAADQGHAGAQAALGELYEAGRGVPQDNAEAAKWYLRAAEQGNVTGQYSLAVLYVLGKGVRADNLEALKWYREAANQGDDLSQYNLGMRYYEGSSVAADPVEAYKWLSLAAAQGVQDAVQVRDALKGKMTRDQLAEGRRRADAFVKKKSGPPAK
jgi:TPR repeat protein